MRTSPLRDLAPLIRTIPLVLQLGAVTSTLPQLGAQGVFIQNGTAMAYPRFGFTSTPLPNGKVLIVGGSSEKYLSLGGHLDGTWFWEDSGALNLVATSELYDPFSRTFSSSGKLTASRYDHASTLLPDGTVLVTGGIKDHLSDTGFFGGGWAYFVPLAAAEIYNPSTGTFTPTAGPMLYARYNHTSTLLPNGKVLILGGGYYSSSGFVHIARAELYDPATRSFSSAGFITGGIVGHTATLLPSGMILVAGGDYFASAAQPNAPNLGMLYDPTHFQATKLTQSLGQPRRGHTATLQADGTVLLSGGSKDSGLSASTEVFNPATATFTPVGNLNRPRSGHTATLLPNGAVLMAGGWSVDQTNTYGVVPTQEAEIYLPWRRAFSASSTFMHEPRAIQSANLLANGKVLMLGGVSKYDAKASTSAELYDPLDPAPGLFSATGSLGSGAYLHSTTLLPNGKILVVGGLGSSPSPTASLYDPQAGTFSLTGNLAYARYKHTTTPLPGGLVLVAGGMGAIGAESRLELYDPAYGWFFPGGTLKVGRRDHTTTLLPNGKVLIVGGISGTTLASAEVYDPATRTTTYTGSLTTPRARHSATLLPSGKVLIVGGKNTVDLYSAEVYDPKTGLFTPFSTRALWQERNSHTATLLVDGRVLITGGMGMNNLALATAEVIDPNGLNPTAVVALTAARVAHTATPLPNGKVLIIGGMSGGATSAPLSSSELFDPFTGTITPTGALGTSRRSHGSILLPNGKVLVLGGYNGGALASAETYQ